MKTGIENGSIFQGPVVLIPSNAPAKQAAAELLAWMMSPEIVAEIAVSTNSLPTSRTAAVDPRFQQTSNFEVFMDLLAAPNTLGLVSTPFNQEIITDLLETEKELLHNQASK